MTTRTADHGFHFKTPRTAFGLAQYPVTQDRARTGAVNLTDWMARLAAWAERQPNHHRLGSWMLMR
jgi:hypothetical protein